ncbi:hypothetical protein L2728_21980, partial [Shewanella chilikensis]|uniref:hypothetical protein n=1 Tax=Shewanella chilikensis TaxID=558541 RepID=UPI00201084C8
LSCRLASLCLLDELLNGVVHDVASDEPRITPLAYMIIRDATHIDIETANRWIDREVLCSAQIP